MQFLNIPHFLQWVARLMKSTWLIASFLLLLSLPALAQSTDRIKPDYPIIITEESLDYTIGDPVDYTMEDPVDYIIGDSGAEEIRYKNFGSQLDDETCKDILKRNWDHFCLKQCIRIIDIRLSDYRDYRDNIVGLDDIDYRDNIVGLDDIEQCENLTITQIANLAELHKLLKYPNLGDLLNKVDNKTLETYMDISTQGFEKLIKESYDEEDAKQVLQWIAISTPPKKVFKGKEGEIFVSWTSSVAEILRFSDDHYGSNILLNLLRKAYGGYISTTKILSPKILPSKIPLVDYGYTTTTKIHEYWTEIQFEIYDTQINLMELVLYTKNEALMGWFMTFIDDHLFDNQKELFSAYCKIGLSVEPSIRWGFLAFVDFENYLDDIVSCHNENNHEYCSTFRPSNWISNQEEDAYIESSRELDDWVDQLCENIEL